MWKVLVIEDDPMLAKIHQDYINMQSCFDCVGIAKNTEQAWEMIKESQPDLLLLDVYLPKTTGIEFLKLLRNRGLGLEVILITASREFDKIEDAFHYGAMDYLIKPFEFDRLKKSLDVFIQRRKASEMASEMNQSELDNIFIGHHMAKDTSDEVLPKGIHAKTLERVFEIVNAYIEPCVIDDIADKVCMSKVAVRKYLVYLEKQELIHVELSHGALGRPSYLYGRAK